MSYPPNMQRGAPGQGMPGQGMPGQGMQPTGYAPPSVNYYTNPPEANLDWRSQLTQEDRGRIVAKIIEVLSQCVDNGEPKNDPKLSQMARKYEESVLAGANSKKEYFEKIATKLYDLKHKSLKNKPPGPGQPMPPNAAGQPQYLPPQGVTAPIGPGGMNAKASMPMARYPQQNQPHLQLPPQAQPQSQSQPQPQPQTAQMNQAQPPTPQQILANQQLHAIPPQLNLKGQPKSRVASKAGPPIAEAQTVSYDIPQQPPSAAIAKKPELSASASKQPTLPRKPVETEDSGKTVPNIGVDLTRAAMQQEQMQKKEAELKKDIRSQAPLPLQQPLPSAPQLGPQPISGQLQSSSTVPAPQAPPAKAKIPQPSSSIIDVVEKVTKWPYADLAPTAQIINNVLSRVTNGSLHNQSIVKLSAESTPKASSHAEEIATFWWDVRNPLQSSSAPSESGTGTKRCFQSLAESIVSVDTGCGVSEKADTLASKIIKLSDRIHRFSRVTEEQLDFCSKTAELIARSHFEDETVFEDAEKGGTLIFRTGPLPFETKLRDPPSDIELLVKCPLPSLNTFIPVQVEIPAKQPQPTALECAREAMAKFKKIDAEIRGVQEHFDLELEEYNPSTGMVLQCCLSDHEGDAPPLRVQLPPDYPASSATYRLSKLATDCSLIQNDKNAFERKLLGIEPPLLLSDLLEKYRATFHQSPASGSSLSFGATSALAMAR